MAQFGHEEVSQLPQKSQFPRTGLECVSCQQPIALVQVHIDKRHPLPLPSL